MRNVLAGFLGVALLVALAAPAFAATETVKGRIVDQSCYMKDMKNNTGVDHKMPADVTGCAVACAKKGNQMALLTDDGKVYSLSGEVAANMNAKLVPHVGHVVEITGDVVTNAGKMTLTAADLKMVSR
jgi:hypothetical protein